MKRIEFETFIAAPPEVVWETMLSPDSYRIWTAEFAAGSTYEGSWEEGAEIRFCDPEGNGMIATIEKNRRHELISIRHLGMIKGGVEDRDSSEVTSWAGAQEIYHFRPNGAGTDVRVEMDVTDDFESFMKGAWPKALAKLKEICEAK